MMRILEARVGEYVLNKKENYFVFFKLDEFEIIESGISDIEEIINKIKPVWKFNAVYFESFESNKYSPKIVPVSEENLDYLKKICKKNYRVVDGLKD